MEKEDIRRYSMEELKEMRARGDYVRTRPDAPESDEGLDEEFWKNARVVMPGERRKDLVSLRIDHEVLEWFREQGKGHLTRMNAVLRSYMEAHRDRHKT